VSLKTGLKVRILILTFSVLCLFVLNSLFEPHYDFNSFWGAGRALLEGRNPYDYGVIQEILYPRATANFNYPLYIAVLVVPLGLFDLEIAKNIWLTASEVLFVLSLYLIKQPTSRSSGTVFSTIACAAFVPTLIALYDQQTSMFVLFLLSVVHYGLQRGRHGLAGAALAMSLIKPQAMALLLVVTLFRLRRQGLVWFAITLVCMLLVAFGLMSDWPYHWWASASWITQEAGRAVPTVWGLSWFLTSGYWLGVLLAAGLVATVLVNPSFSYALTAGLLLPVYMKPYDLVLLFIPVLSSAGGRLLGALVAASYALLLYAALSGRGGDIFILLTVITLGYLLYQDRYVMLESVRSSRARVMSRITRV
jgi:hypothetical protein